MRIGWSITEPTDALIEYILRQGWSEIHMSRQDGYTARGVGGRGTAGGTPTVTPKPSSTRKLICPCCGNSVRATKAVNIICGDCMERMVEV